MRHWLLLSLVVLSAGCGSSSGGASGSGGSSSGGGETSSDSSAGGSSGGGSGSSGGGGSEGTGSSSSGSGGFSGGTASTGGGGDAGVPAGILTAAAWDDNRNYDFFRGYLAANTSLSGIPLLATADRDAAHTLFTGTRGSRQQLDVAIVIDTTGSMGDEAAYLQSEFVNIRGAIGTQFPGADQHWALVAYRDTPDHDPGDDYVVKSWDFTPDSATFQGWLDGLTAANGADTPESPDLGLAKMNALTWRTDPAVARMAFWVADAPHHDDRAPAMVQAFSDAHQKDIHLYPVSASGADELLELTMRSGAQLTGGRYLFLTDDSGVGGPHLQPSIPCYFVTKLGQAIVRMVSIELSGVYEEPVASEIIRTGGDPKAGQCAIDDGGTVNVF